MDNIDCFNEVIGFVFSMLYPKFPLPAVLPPVQIRTFVRTPLSPEGMDKQQAEKDADAFVAYSIHWLEQEGYIRAEPWNGTHGWVLSSKGLQLLSAVPEGLKNSFGEELAGKVKEGAMSGLGEIAKRVISLGGSALIHLAMAKSFSSL